MVPNHSVLEGKLAERITWGSPVPHLLPRAVAASSKSRSGSTACRVHNSPVVCSCVLHSSVVTEPMLTAKLAVQEILPSYSYFSLYTGDFLFFPGCFPYSHFWVMDFSFSRYLTELDHGYLSLTMALDNKLDCKSVTQQILNSVTPKHKASVHWIFPMPNCYQ